MAQDDLNPYRPAPALGSSVKRFQSHGSLSIAIVSALYTLAYMALIVFLFRSPGGDRTSAIMLLCNVPFLVVLVVAANRSTRMATYLAFTVVCVQAVIAVGMTLVLSGDQRRIAEVNFALALPLLGVAAWSWVVTRLRFRRVP